VAGIGSAFFLSGAAALVYQVAWQRILELQTGVGIYSVAAIVAAFMAGLGLGSLAGGLWSERLSAGRSLRAFALVELAIGAFGSLSCWFFHDWLYRQNPWLWTSHPRAVTVQFFALLLPTGLMGMSLPFLVRAMVRGVEGAGRTIGLLYAVNIFGAAMGALVTPWLLMRYLGIRGAVTAAVVANVVAGSVAWLTLAPTGRMQDAPPRPAAPDLRSRGLGTRSYALWMAIYGLSGFCALALEVLWFRLIEIAVRATPFTFGTVLGIYLAGSGAGCLLGVFLLQRLGPPLRAFLLCECGLLATSALAVTALIRLPATTPLLASYVEAWSQSRVFKLGHSWDIAGLAQWYVLLPVFLFGLPTILMGLSFPLLQRAVQDDVRTSGRKVGVLQGANIAGCIAGSLLVGLVLLSLVGSMGTLRLITSLGLVFAAIGVACCERRVFLAAGVVVAGAAMALPSGASLWARLHHAAPRQRPLVAEDSTGVAVVTDRTESRHGGWDFWIGGRVQSQYPFGGYHTVLGAIPAVVHRSPRRALVIGLGSGDTASAVALRPDLPETIDVFEICRPNLALLRRIVERDGGPLELSRVLADPRVRYHVADGRNALERSPDKYDIIEMDAVWPDVAYSGNLYSVEFYRLCASRLTPGGLVSCWAPTPRVRQSFRRAFPHVLTMRRGRILLGSNAPIPIERQRWKSVLHSEVVRARLGVQRAREVMRTLRAARPLPGLAAEGGADEAPLNHDLFPRDELISPD
jgi:spermidine synthase